MLSWGSALLLWQGGPPWSERVGQVGLVAFFGLLAWWSLTGFTGYEHVAGVRIVGRQPPRSLRTGWPLLFMATSATGLVALGLGYRSVVVVAVVAVGTMLTLLSVLVRKFSVFGTIAVFGVAIGVAGLIVVQSVATGFQHEFERRVLGVYAHINVTRAFGISEYRRFERYLRTVPGVEGASPFVYYAMALAPYDPEGGDEEFRRATVLVKGIEPTTAHEVIDVVEHLERGSDRAVALNDLTSDVALRPVPDREDDRLPEVIAATPDPRGEGWYEKAIEHYRSLPESIKRGAAPGLGDDGSEEEDDDDEAGAPPVVDAERLPTMFVGNTLARELDLEIGDVVSLVDPGAGIDTSRGPQFQYYRIAGTFQAGFHEYDSRLVYVHIKELQYFRHKGKDIVSGVDLRLSDPHLAQQVGAVLSDTIGEDEYSLLEWQDLNRSLFQSIETQKSIITVIISLVSTVAGFNVLAALWTMVVRRGAEIAIMMSMGATEAGVARIFQFAGMVIGVVGSLAGVALGLVLCWLVQLYGYTLDPEVYFIERLPVELSLVQISAVLALTLAICFVATIPPALRAAKLRPVDGLRYE